MKEVQLFSESCELSLIVDLHKVQKSNTMTRRLIVNINGVAQGENSFPVSYHYTKEHENSIYFAQYGRLGLYYLYGPKRADWCLRQGF